MRAKYPRAGLVHATHTGLQIVARQSFSAVEVENTRKGLSLPHFSGSWPIKSQTDIGTQPVLAEAARRPWPTANAIALEPTPIPGLPDWHYSRYWGRDKPISKVKPGSRFNSG